MGCDGFQTFANEAQPPFSRSLFASETGKWPEPITLYESTHVSIRMHFKAHLHQFLCLALCFFIC
eukprot:m.6076 g.6076  ORF g.6076 m.6076 type:complete len:65 (-) comp5125_c0_seq1:189-383(-)